MREGLSGCRVFLATLKELHPAGATTEAPFYDRLPLAWAGWKFVALDVPVGVAFYVDLLRISKETAGWNFSVYKKLNEQIQNAGFEPKKQVYKDSRLEVTKALLKYQDWSPEQVDKRQTELCGLAEAIWPPTLI
jgi:hypothetical protein